MQFEQFVMSALRFNQKAHADDAGSYYKGAGHLDETRAGPGDKRMPRHP